MSASKMGNSNGKNQPNSIEIEVTDLELNTKTTFGSICEAARALNINHGVITAYFKRNQNKPFSIPPHSESEGLKICFYINIRKLSEKSRG